MDKTEKDMYSENLAILEILYNQFLTAPETIDQKWKEYFKNLHANIDLKTERVELHLIDKNPTRRIDAEEQRKKSYKDIIEVYRDWGYLSAQIDPLGFRQPNRVKIQKLKNQIYELHSTEESGILSDLFSKYEQIYCSSIALNIHHLEIEEEKEWFYAIFESEQFKESVSNDLLERIYYDLVKSDEFEKFLNKKYLGKKRFSLEGGESLNVLLNSLFQITKNTQTEGIVMGMAHRGRLNVLVNVLEKPLHSVFAEFDENYDPATPDYSDVKYHLGYSANKNFDNGKSVHLTLMFNPSHLEAVHPVVCGSLRARQTQFADEKREKYWGIVIHGDAAFSGQGVVAESLNLTKTPGFEVGGVVHIVLNNQIAFTTDPNESRGGEFATSISRAYQIPVIHVNGDDPLAVHNAAELAYQYRDRFKRDIIIDLIVYRRHGHNEMDEPTFTQPLLYKIISTHPPILKIFENKLQEMGYTKEYFDKTKTEVGQNLEKGLEEERSKNIKMEVDTLHGVWSDIMKGSPDYKLPSKDDLIKLGTKLVEIPDGYDLHPKLLRYFVGKKEMYSGNAPLDWAAAESLALAILLKDGYKVRFSGQDVSRGTFSHRHAVLNDYLTGTKFSPLEHISEGGIEIVNSPLSEFAVLGYEYGFSLSDPKTMVIWEAQFGDFANGAQVVFDQFISSAEEKWHRKSGLTVLLPHGYEGQGPEHSSARLERFLQLAAGDNMRIVNPSTSSQYFHILCRQMLLPERKPLLVFSPKSLLRLQQSSSSLSEFYKTGYYPVINETEVKNPKRVIFCSGKLYYDLKNERDKQTGSKAAIIRLEQLYPFPEKEILEIVKQNKNARQYVWAQEEPENMGAYSYLKNKLLPLLPQNAEFLHSARLPSAAPAVGIYKIHEFEQKKVINNALGVDH